jgi:hypothetical protein
MVDSAAVVFLLILGCIVLFARDIVVSEFGSTSDKYGHLIRIRKIKQSGHQQSVGLNHSEVTGGYDVYPYLLHWCLSFLPDDAIALLSKRISLLMDLAIWCVFVVLSLLGHLSPLELSVCLLFFVTTPEFVRPDRAQNKGLSTRKLGLVLVTIAILSFLFWQHYGNLLFLLLAVATGAAIFLTSKFGLQAFFLINLCLSFTVTPIWILYLFGCFGIATIASRGAYLSVLEGHLRHLYLFATQLQYTHKKVVNKQFLPLDLLVEFNRWRKGKRTVKDIVLAAHNNIPFQAVVNHPFLFPTVAVLFLAWTTGSFNSSPELNVWILAGGFGFLFTSIPGLRFLGEPERYLEFVFVPSAILIAGGVTTLDTSFRLLTLATVLAGGVTVVSYVAVVRQIEDDGTDDEDFKDILTHLADETQSIILLQPTNRGKEVSYKTKHKAVWWGGHMGSTPETLDEFNRLHPETYPFVTDDIGWLADQYDPDWVLFDFGRLDTGTGFRPPESTETNFQSGSYEVYRFEKLLTNQPAEPSVQKT